MKENGGPFPARWPLKIEIGSDLATLSSERNYYLSSEIIGQRITVTITILIMTIAISNNNN